MKKSVLIFFSILLCLSLAACAEQNIPPTVSEERPVQEELNTQSFANNSSDEANNSQAHEASETNMEMSEMTKRKLKMTIDGQEILITLYDTPAANALYNMLPLTLTFKDFNNTEKIAYMDHELSIEGEPDEFDPSVGDLCLYVPWGNLTIFYRDFQSSNGLISLGHIDSGIELIENMQDNVSVTLSKI